MSLKIECDAIVAYSMLSVPAEILPGFCYSPVEMHMLAGTCSHIHNIMPRRAFVVCAASIRSNWYKVELDMNRYDKWPEDYRIIIGSDIIQAQKAEGVCETVYDFPGGLITFHSYRADVLLWLINIEKMFRCFVCKLYLSPVNHHGGSRCISVLPEYTSGEKPRYLNYMPTDTRYLVHSTECTVLMMVSDYTRISVSNLSKAAKYAGMLGAYLYVFTPHNYPAR